MGRRRRDRLPGWGDLDPGLDGRPGRGPLMPPTPPLPKIVQQQRRGRHRLTLVTASDDSWGGTANAPRSGRSYWRVSWTDVG